MNTSMKPSPPNYSLISSKNLLEIIYIPIMKIY